MFLSVISNLQITPFFCCLSVHIYVKPINDGGTHNLKNVRVAKIMVKVDLAFIRVNAKL